MNRITVLLSCLALLGLGTSVRAEDDHGHDYAAAATPPAAVDEHAVDEHAGHGHAEPVVDEHAGHGHAEAEEDEYAEVVQLTAGELTEFDIEVSTAAPDTIETYVVVPGEVRANADRLAHIVPRFSGIVTGVHAKIGDSVSKGQVLAVVESDESLAPFDVTTMIRGTIIEKHIALGEAVSRNNDIFLIADLSTVWVDLTVYQRDLDRIRKGQSVQVLVGHESAPDPGIISYVTPVVDEVTRTATARIVLPNDDGHWRPGMFVRGKILIDRSAADVAVPRTALQTYEEQTVVFVETPDGFVPRSVYVGQTGELNVELLYGLAPGERYVSRGGFTIKAELGRDSLGHAGHAH